jgi:hypothetical protein
MGNLDGVINNKGDGTKEKSKDTIALFRSKECYSKGNGRSGLNFKGRGRVASTKNIQLVVQDLVGASNCSTTTTTTTKTTTTTTTSTKIPPIHCQMAKWDTNTFHVDYQSPMCTLYAFAFALAQLDL